jgi:hypothetical protein
MLLHITHRTSPNHRPKPANASSLFCTHSLIDSYRPFRTHSLSVLPLILLTVLPLFVLAILSPAFLTALPPLPCFYAVIVSCSTNITPSLSMSCATSPADNSQAIPSLDYLNARYHHSAFLSLAFYRSIITTHSTTSPTQQPPRPICSTKSTNPYGCSICTTLPSNLQPRSPTLSLP